jgi:rhamnose utilization protein RhaD (predicted bifunctional aldolase and dehydrogenase)
MSLYGRDDAEYRALLELSARLGADPLRTQAAGGNTSVKRDGLMWIKASGTWLADALVQDIMTPVRLAPMLGAIEANDPRAATGVDFVDRDLAPEALRPSIETSVHAIIPFPVVVHIHCVDTIALAVRTDGEAIVKSRLRRFHDVVTALIPYVKPGLPLAQAIGERSGAKPNVLILGNHGLVVGGASVAETAERIERVCGALSAPARVAAEPDFETLAALVDGSGYRLPLDAAAHATALDPVSLDFARRGSLYPDHVVFLGPGVVEATLAGGRLAALPDRARPPAMLVAPGVGIVLHRPLAKSADALARCLADVTARIPVGASVRTLTAAQDNELLEWEAEAYRKALATQAAGR